MQIIELHLQEKDTNLERWSSFIDTLSESEVRLFVCDSLSEPHITDKGEFFFSNFSVLSRVNQLHLLGFLISDNWYS